ncbi:MAG: DUF5074 domain-containing protein [Bacteroidales bacterium]|nr:DUF5074 domain-containing protein [Bacteroidales bacterium]
MKAFKYIFSCLVLCLLFACKPDPMPSDDPVQPVDTTHVVIDTTTIIVDTTIVIVDTTNIIVDTTNIIVDTVVPRKGVLVLNEGNFTYANASLTFYDPETNEVKNNVFMEANDVPIGDVGQSLTLLDGKLYIVVNNSNYIYKADAETFVCDLDQPYMISGFNSPRIMLPVAPDKAYVSDIVGTNLWVINPQTMTHTGTVAMGKSTEHMLRVGDALFVTNWSRYYVPGMVNNTVQVVDINSDTKVADIEVGYEPNFLVLDKNGYIWVMCEGDVNDPTIPSELWKIDPVSKTGTKVKAFEEKDPVTQMYLKSLNLAIDPTGTYLYFVYGGDWTVGGDVRRINVDSPEEMDDFVISGADKMFYKLSVDPFNGDLYVTDAKSYVQDGTVYRYSAQGTLLNSFDAGICPGYILFY